MKKTITLSIPAACSAKWENFTQTTYGGFCHSCSKTVIDFTSKSDEEIKEYFKGKPAHTCGRFRTNQLKNYVYQTPPSIKPGFGLVKASSLCLFLMMVSKPTFAQTKPTAVMETVQSINTAKASVDSKVYLVKGVVTSDEDGMALPGVNIWLKGSEVGTVSDTDGKFEFPKKLKEGEVLVFSFIGLETQEYKVPASVSDLLDVKLAINMEMSCMVTLGAVAVEEIYSEPTALQKFWSKVKSLF
jgi:hypothetical protein